MHLWHWNLQPPSINTVGDSVRHKSAALVRIRCALGIFLVGGEESAQHEAPSGVQRGPLSDALARRGKFKDKRRWACWVLKQSYDQGHRRQKKGGSRNQSSARPADALSILRGRWERQVRGACAKQGILNVLIYSRGFFLVLRVWKEK